jgi:hypothetical protein
MLAVTFHPCRQRAEITPAHGATAAQVVCVGQGMSVPGAGVVINSAAWARKVSMNMVTALPLQGAVLRQ